MPPQYRGEEFELDWDKINAGVSGIPVQYPLTLRGDNSGEEEEEEEDAPSLPVICHRVKVQRCSVCWSKYHGRLAACLSTGLGVVTAIRPSHSCQISSEITIRVI